MSSLIMSVVAISLSIFVALYTKIRRDKFDNELHKIGAEIEELKQDQLDPESPTIQIDYTKQIGKQLNARGVVIVSFDKNYGFVVTGYGDTMENYNALNNWADRIKDELETGYNGPDWT